MMTVWLLCTTGFWVSAAAWFWLCWRTERADCIAAQREVNRLRALLAEERMARRTVADEADAWPRRRVRQLAALLGEVDR